MGGGNSHSVSFTDFEEDGFEEDGDEAMVVWKGIVIDRSFMPRAYLGLFWD